MADLKAFENLRETGKDSLSGAEKNALNAIKEGDLRAAKDEIGKKEFDIDGKKMSVQQIVENLKFSSDWKTAYLNWKPIATTSELWAALQVYAIANNKGIGWTKIDGWLWKNSNQWLSNVQQDLGIERKPAPKENSEGSSMDKMGIAELLSKPFKKYFDEWERDELYDKRVMDRNTYVLIPTNSLSYKSDKKLKFSYQFEGKNLQIEVPIEEDADGYVDAKKLADTIRDKINTARDNRTTEVHNLSADGGIDEFKEKNIKNPIIRKWATANGVNFVATVLNGGKIKVEAIKKKNSLYSFECNNTDVLSNWSFDANKFNSLLDKNCYDTALKDVKSRLQTTKSWIDKDNTKITRSMDASWVVTKYDNLIKEITSYYNSSTLDATQSKMISNDLAEEEANAVDARNFAKMKEDCYKRLEGMDSDIAVLNKMSRVLTTENKQKVLQIIEKYSDLTKLWTGKFDYRYKQYVQKGWLKDFKATSLNDKYQLKLKTMRDIASEYEIDITV